MVRRVMELFSVTSPFGSGRAVSSGEVRDGTIVSDSERPPPGRYRSDLPRKRWRWQNPHDLEAVG